MPVVPFLAHPLALLWLAGAALLVLGLVLGYLLGYRDGRQQPCYVLATPVTAYPMRITVIHDLGPLAEGVVPAAPAVLDGQRGEVVP